MINYTSYLERRGWGLTAIEAYRETKTSEEEAEGRSLVQALVSVAIELVVFQVVGKVVRGITGDNIWEGRVWITSPSGKTKREVPLRIALRVIRKHEWEFAEVEPVKPQRVVSRREAFKILMSGDNGKYRSIPRKV